MRTLAWIYLLVKYRREARQGWRWGQGKDSFTKYARNIQREFVDVLRRDMNCATWASDEDHRAIHFNRWYIPTKEEL